jgi:hypothetical protein
MSFAHMHAPQSHTASAALYAFAPCLVTPLEAAAHVLLLPQTLREEACIAAARAQSSAGGQAVTLVLGAGRACTIDPQTLAVTPVPVPRPALLRQGVIAPAMEFAHTLEDELRLLRLRENCD